jgi:cobalt/nickel transport system permease protein
MTLAFTPPPCPDSPLRRLDPRWKLAALTPAALAAAVLRTLPAALLALGLAVLLAALARLPPRWALGRLGAVALFLALFALPLPFLLDGPGPSWQWGAVHLSPRGASAALLLCVKALAVVTLALVVLATAPLDATLKAAHALRVPGLIIQLALLTYRYLFLLADELGRLRTALRVRGYRNRMNRHSYRTVGHVAGTLLVRGYERAERVGQAMRCRGFDGQFRSLTTFRTRAADVVVFVVILAGAAGLCWLDRLPLSPP